MQVKYYTIKARHDGDEYDAIVDSDCIYDDADVLNGCSGEVYELGTEGLPDWVDDIRGKIHGEPERVFVERSNDQQRVYYFGLSSAE